MHYQIKNFTDADALTVSHRPATTDLPAVVTVTQFAGSMHFHHAMTAEQARWMASALRLAAEAIDPPQMPAVEGGAL